MNEKNINMYDIKGFNPNDYLEYDDVDDSFFLPKAVLLRWFRLVYPNGKIVHEEPKIDLEQTAGRIMSTCTIYANYNDENSILSVAHARRGAAELSMIKEKNLDVFDIVQSSSLRKALSLAGFDILPINDINIRQKLVEEKKKQKRIMLDKLIHGKEAIENTSFVENDNVKYEQNIDEQNIDIEQDKSNNKEVENEANQENDCCVEGRMNRNKEYNTTDNEQKSINNKEEKVKRGRPKKNKDESLENNENKFIKKRGRPKKNEIENEINNSIEKEDTKEDIKEEVQTKEKNENNNFVKKLPTKEDFDSINLDILNSPELQEHLSQTISTTSFGENYIGKTIRELFNPMTPEKRRIIKYTIDRLSSSKSKDIQSVICVANKLFS